MQFLECACPPFFKMRDPTHQAIDFTCQTLCACPSPISKDMEGALGAPPQSISKARRLTRAQGGIHGHS